MTIQNGCIADACDVMGSLKETFRLVAINSNQQAMYYWGSTQSGGSYLRNSYCEVYGNNNSNCAGNVVYACNHGLCLTNYSTCFTGCVGCWSDYNLCDCYCMCGFYTSVTNCNFRGSINNCCVGTLFIESGHGSTGHADTSYYMIDRLQADCYRVCISFFNCVTSGGSCCNIVSSITQLFFGTTTIFCRSYTCTYWSGTTCCCDTPRLYEFVRNNADGRYCFFCNGSFQCCIDAGAFCFYEGDNRGNGPYNSCASLRLHEFTVCNTNTIYQLSCPITFPEPYNYVLLTTTKGDCSCCCYGGTDVLCADLLCCDCTFIKNLPFNCVTNVTNGACQYRVRIYNCCVCNCVNTCPLCYASWALSGVLYNG